MTFLRWFSKYRELEDLVGKLRKQVNLLFEQKRKLEFQLDEARTERDKAQEAAMHAHSMVADWLAEMRFGRPIFGSKAPLIADSLPQEAVDVGGQGKVQGRDLVRQLEAEFNAKLAERGGVQ